MRKKKIVIFGPIGDFGGREVEVNIIAKALQDNFDVTILSSTYMTENSFALNELQNVSWNCVSKSLYEKSSVLKTFAKFSKLKSKGKYLNYFYCNNAITKKIFNYNKLQWQVIENEIKNANLVLSCMQLTSQFLPEIIQFCSENKIPSLVRTTGTIRKFDSIKFNFLKKATLFIHHSQANALNLNNQINLPYVVIDQCALHEESLLKLPISARSNLRFGYLGRLSEEKGILELVTFFSNKKYCFKVAGNGPQKEIILQTIKKNSLCEYLGQFNSEQITAFFNQIDVLIISSHEESGPLVALEAMAAGKLIISTKVGAMEERLEGLQPFWFDVSHTASLNESIVKLESFTEEQLNELSKKIRNRYLEKYSFEKIKTSYLNLAKEFIGYN